ncbi:DarT ssDNA thymidine ADP-ribosyltransferase family protein [Pyxidicoccus xibeiensis]|uniref:DarT ssDNA thymidine ADP-ribosyltransferase family protein n=1 Tax=Pyxidicoccus xibeiensis TaxID=2906759 RepID=UPI0020A800C4|nr:DarT ssDNA thymidine ADP-ribosyltransferase family protein [Pyxidicoccus xibeiensis]MCP3138182.1 DarT ssDNA thymidine ADP-ribosyltransferase family protein [Pyxidicoccus xibeiensis]
MPIPDAHKHRFAYHFTHLDNLKNALQMGFLSCNKQKSLGIAHLSVADSEIQKRRAKMVVTCAPGGVVHDYVPLYFTKLSPMLLQIVRAKNVDQMLLIHFAFPISLLEYEGSVFTDAAANGNTSPSFYTDPSDLNKLNWTAIDSTKWKTPEGDKQARMAELLIYEQLDPKNASHIYAWNDHYAAQIKEIYKSVGVQPPPIRFHGPGDSHCFTNFAADLPQDMRNRSIAAGPVQTKLHFTNAVETITSQTGKAKQPRFASLNEMLDAFRAKGLGVLPETAELINLESKNEVHKHDVGTHTLKVVEKLRSSEEFASLKSSDQMLTELAAYLHDIGKGPKSRWVASGGNQLVDPDHPLRSVDMLIRALTEDVGTIKSRHIRALCMLVCYHDLVGDIIGIGRGRKKTQLLDIVESERELDMLIAVGKADLSSVASSWEATAFEKIPPLREWCLDELSTKGEQ